MRVLVAQTTRMGDVIQTSPLIRMIRRQHPEAHITVMVRRMGKVIAEHHPDINEVIVYDEDEMFLDMRSGDSDRLLHAYETAEERIRSLKAAHFDVAYNVTHSLASSMLMKLAEIPQVIGAHLSDDWQFVLRGDWTTYFFTSVFSRDYNDLNLCDISRHFAAEAPPCRELVFEVREEEREFVRQLMRERHIGGQDFVACLQLGASETSKRWTVERFAALAKLLAEEFSAKIFLLGVKEEAPHGEEFQKHAPGLAHPLFGKTTVPQVAALLERANVLITNDTGTMHLAAAVGCPVTLVSVGHVHYRETGPYGEGHCAIEGRRATLGRSDYVPGGDEERNRILPEQVLEAMKTTLAYRPEEPLRQIDETPNLASVDLYMTHFAPDGCLQFYPLIRRAMIPRDFIRIAYRAMWLHHLNPKHDKRIETESLRLMLEHYTGPGPETVKTWRRELGQSFSRLADMAQRGIRMTESLLDMLEKRKGMKRAQQLVTELMALDEEARVFSEINPPCRPLILIARFERDNLEGADPLHLAKTTLEIYRACFARARLTERKINRIAELCAAR